MALEGPVKRGDVLFVYYTGHGYSQKGQFILATYNAEVGSRGWKMERAFAQIGKSFKGRELLFLADCCSSGRPVDYAKKVSPKVTVLTSAGPGEEVPEGWAFTTAMTEALSGSIQVDKDADGLVNWDEACSHVLERVATAYGSPGLRFVPEGFDLSWGVREPLSSTVSQGSRAPSRDATPGGLAPRSPR